MSERTAVEDIVTIANGIRADRTLDQYDQDIRVDLVRAAPPRCQVLIDWRHIKNPTQSKPRAYLTYSRNTELFRLGQLFYAAGLAMALRRQDTPITERQVEQALAMDVGDITHDVNVYLKALRATPQQVEIEVIGDP